VGEVSADAARAGGGKVAAMIPEIALATTKLERERKTVSTSPSPGFFVFAMTGGPARYP
jgi:hypothetical protein